MRGVLAGDRSRKSGDDASPLAYALTVDPPLELRIGEEHISVPMPYELVMEGKVTAEGERARLGLELSWSPAASKV